MLLVAVIGVFIVTYFVIWKLMRSVVIATAIAGFKAALFFLVGRAAVHGSFSADDLVYWVKSTRFDQLFSDWQGFLLEPERAWGGGHWGYYLVNWVSRQVFSDAPFGPLFVNSIVGVISGYLVFLVAREMTGKHRFSAIAGSLFVVMPESLMWTSYNFKDSWVQMMTLAFLIFGTKAVKNREFKTVAIFSLVAILVAISIWPFRFYVPVIMIITLGVWLSASAGRDIRLEWQKRLIGGMTFLVGAIWLSSYVGFCPLVINSRCGEEVKPATPEETEILVAEEQAKWILVHVVPTPVSRQDPYLWVEIPKPAPSAPMPAPTPTVKPVEIVVAEPTPTAVVNESPKLEPDLTAIATTQAVEAEIVAAEATAAAEIRPPLSSQLVGISGELDALIERAEQTYKRMWIVRFAGALLGAAPVLGDSLNAANNIVERTVLDLKAASLLLDTAVSLSNLIEETPDQGGSSLSTLSMFPSSIQITRTAGELHEAAELLRRSGELGIAMEGYTTKIGRVTSADVQLREREEWIGELLAWSLITIDSFEKLSGLGKGFEPLADILNNPKNDVAGLLEAAGSIPEITGDVRAAAESLRRVVDSAPQSIASSQFGNEVRPTGEIRDAAPLAPARKVVQTKSDGSSPTAALEFIDVGGIGHIPKIKGIPRYGWAMTKLAITPRPWSINYPYWPQLFPAAALNWLLIPFTLLGGLFLLRRRRDTWLILFYTLAVMSALAMFTTLIGPRQRFMLYPVIYIAQIYGLKIAFDYYRSRDWTRFDNKSIRAIRVGMTSFTGWGTRRR